MRTKGHALLAEYMERESLTDYGVAAQMQTASGAKDKLVRRLKRAPTQTVRRVRGGAIPQYLTRRLLCEASDGFVSEESWEELDRDAL